MVVDELLEPLTPEEDAALEELARARALGHTLGCACHPCRGARASWAGRIDEAERLLATYTEAEIEQLVTRGFVERSKEAKP